MASDLLAAQTFLVSAIRRETRTPHDPEMAALAASFVTGNDRLTAAQQVDIYRIQYFLRHERTLREDYPGLQGIVGKDATQVFFRRYLEAHPPATPSLRDVGAHLPAFAAHYADFPPERRDLILEMAHYELELVDVFDGPDAPPLDPAKLAAMTEDDWNKARIVLHPLVVRLSLSYPVHRLRVAIKAGEDVVLPDAPAPVHILLFRQDLIPRYEEVSAEAHALIGALAEGLPLIPALERIAGPLPPERQEYVMSHIGAWFQTWTAWGLIVDIVPNG
ncbi:MAG TPA: DNA-binding domain-containing protein [Polyangium sp.]|nr:DNA-binding domain-containing protein [Polyangium sp.]